MINVEQYLGNFYKGSKQPSLNTITYFMNIYNNFEKDMNFIHIAGTNGKGSCTQIMSTILIAQGYKVGKFLSPHLIKFNERISINEIDITDEELSNLILELEPSIKAYEFTKNIKVSYFELITIIALLFFYRNNVDFVIMETGLGGLNDSTNIISNPLVSMITSVGYDHIQTLGTTLTEIATQKAGIIKPNSDTVIFNQSSEINDVFKKKCNLVNNNLHIVFKDDIKNYEYDDNFQYFDFNTYTSLKLNLKGQIQVNNACLCLETCNILKSKGYKILNSSIKAGLKKITNHARMEILNNNPLILFDGAHNEPAIENLNEMLNMYYKNRKKTFIISILKRKNYKKMLKHLSKNRNSTFVLTSGTNTSKFISNDVLYDIMKTYTSEFNIIKSDFTKAISDSLLVKNDSVNIFVGSFYTYETVIKELKSE